MWYQYTCYTIYKPYTLVISNFLTHSGTFRNLSYYSPLKCIINWFISCFLALSGSLYFLWWCKLLKTIVCRCFPSFFLWKINLAEHYLFLQVRITLTPPKLSWSYLLKTLPCQKYSLDPSRTISRFKSLGFVKDLVRKILVGN